MDLHLKNKKVLVTGSSSGIGKAIAKAIAKEGAQVMVHGRNEQRANNIMNEIIDSGGSAFMALGDLSTDEGAEKVFNRVIKEFGQLDILVNNAGEFHARNWMETTPDDWNKMYNTNVVSMIRLIRMVIPTMKEQGWGRIIQMSSITAHQPFPLWPDYGASKAAISNLTVSLAKELAETGITINSVSPGTTASDGATPFFHDALKMFDADTDDREQLEKNVVKHLLYNPTGRVGKEEDIADLVAFLASPRTDFINGTNFRIDGGASVGVS